MATARQKQSFIRLNRAKIGRYKGNSRSRDDIIVVMGPIVKMAHPISHRVDYVGKMGMYWIRCYRKSRGQWVLGKFDRSCWWPVDADKMAKQAKKFAKSMYYIPIGGLKVNGKNVRRDYELRPPRR